MSVTVYDCAPASGTRIKAVAAHTLNLILLIVQSFLVNWGQQSRVSFSVNLSVCNDLPHLIDAVSGIEKPA
jgi:hypothetical protein